MLGASLCAVCVNASSDEKACLMTDNQVIGYTICLFMVTT